MVRGRGQRGQGEASGKMTRGGGSDDTRQAGSGGHNKRVVVAVADDGGTRNVQASANVDAIVLQLLALGE